MILQSSLVQRPRLTRRCPDCLTTLWISCDSGVSTYSYYQEFMLGWLHNLNFSVCAAEVSTTAQFLAKTNSWEKWVEEILNKQDSETVLISPWFRQDGQLNIISQWTKSHLWFYNFTSTAGQDVTHGTMRSLPRCVLSLFWISFKWSASSSLCFSIQPDFLVHDFHISLAPSSLSKFSPILNRYKYPHHKAQLP